MKKLKYLFLLLLLMPISVSAATVNCSAPGEVTLGDTFTVTFSGSLSSPASVWFAKIGSTDNVTYSGGGLSIDGVDGASMSHSVSFKATSTGQARFYAYDVDVSDGTNSYSDSGECYTNIVEPAPVIDTNKLQGNINNYSNDDNNTSNNEEQNKITDASLKSLSVVGFDLKPAFNKDKLEYSVELKSDTTKIKVEAQATENVAIVTGIGEIEVKEGLNKINIVVALPNGNSKTYVINAYVLEKDPINITINKIKYTVSKKLTGLTAPDGFELKKIKIKDIELESFYNKKLDYYLVALKDEIGNISLYVYDMENDKYTKYLPIKSNELSIIVLKAPESTIPYRYYKSIFKYNGEEVIGYAFSEKSSFRLIYGMDIATGKKGYYLYDMDQKTLQRFYNDQTESYIRLMDKIKIAFIVLGSFVILLVIIIIILLSKNVKFKKAYLKKKFGNPIDSIDSPVIYQDLEGTTKIDVEEIKDFDIKKKKKEKKKKEKTFLDE